MMRRSVESVLKDGETRREARDGDRGNIFEDTWMRESVTDRHGNQSLESPVPGSEPYSFMICSSFYPFRRGLAQSWQDPKIIRQSAQE